MSITFCVQKNMETSEEDGRIVGAFVIPHGTQSLPSTEEERMRHADYLLREFKSSFGWSQEEEFEKMKKTCELISNSCMEAAKDMKKLEPEVILMLTPHGFQADSSFLVYSNGENLTTDNFDNVMEKLYFDKIEHFQGMKKKPSVAAGTTEWNGNVPYEVSAILEKCVTPYKEDLIERTKREFRRKVRESEESEWLMEYSIQKIRNSPCTPFPLYWGETTPLHFLWSQYDNNEKKPNILVITPPVDFYRERTYERKMKIASIFGESVVRNLIKPLKKKVAVIASADLHHGFRKSVYLSESSGEIKPSITPDPESSKKFGKYVEQWVKSGRKDRKYGAVKEHYSCGQPMFILLDGILDGLEENMKPKVYMEETKYPTYYGMLVAGFLS